MRKYIPVLILIAILAMANSSVVLAAPERQGGGTIHYVTWGESLTGIAAQYGVTVEAILRQNGLTDPNMIYIGQPLVIPAGQYGPPGGYPGGQYGPPGGYANPPGACANLHTVKMGETLSSIAWNYGLPAEQLLQYNNLYNKDIVIIGQTLCIPGRPGYVPQPSADYGYSPPPANNYYHVVVAGETLSSIAQQYRVSPWSIVQANSLNNASYIWVGQKLVIPGYQPQPVYQPHPPAYAQPEPPRYSPPPAPPAYDGGGYGDNYHRPPYSPPPAAPHYDDAYDDSYAPPPYKPPLKDDKTTPPAPEYQTSPVAARLPEAEHPITVVVNGGETWADDVYPAKYDPDGITTLIVQTGEELGRTVRVRSGDYEVKGESEFTGEFGAYRFVFRYIPPGDYDVWIDDPEVPSETAQVEVKASQRVEVFFSKQVRFQGQTFASPDGWVLSNWKNPSKPGQNIGGWSNILVRTPASGLNVMIESEGGGYKAKCFTGSKGPGACDFAGLMAGIYFIWIDGTDLTLKTYMDGNAYAEFEFAHQ